jgi:hypothetical protein
VRDQVSEFSKPGGKRFTHTRWSGGRGYLRRGKWIRNEKFVSGRGECVCVKVY